MYTIAFSCYSDELAEKMKLPEVLFEPLSFVILSQFRVIKILREWERFWSFISSIPVIATMGMLLNNNTRNILYTLQQTSQCIYIPGLITPSQFEKSSIPGFSSRSVFFNVVSCFLLSPWYTSHHGFEKKSRIRDVYIIHFTTHIPASPHFFRSGPPLSYPPDSISHFLFNISYNYAFVENEMCEYP